MDKLQRTLARDLRRSLVDTIHEKAHCAVTNVRSVALHMEDIDTVAAGSLSEAIDALQQLDNAMSVLSAAASHKKEAWELFWGGVSSLSDVHVILRNLEPHMRARLIDGFPNKTQDEIDEIMEVLFDVEPAESE